MRSSASFVAGDLRGKHLPSMSSLELSSMLAAWVDPKKCPEYEHELMISCGRDFDDVALKIQGTEDDCPWSGKLAASELSKRPFRASTGGNNLCHGENVEKYLEPSSSELRKRKQYDLDDAACTFLRFTSVGDSKLGLSDFTIDQAVSGNPNKEINVRRITREMLCWFHKKKS